MSETCRLYTELGEAQACPGAVCGLWEDGSELVEGRCALTRLGIDVRSRPDLAEWLVGLRLELERARGRTAEGL